MIATCVYVQVRQGFVDDFIRECMKNHEKSIKESGNLRFDVIQEVDNPLNFILYEAYDSDEAAIAHKDTDHYKQWRQNVEHMMARPRSGVKHNFISPKEL